MGGIDATRRFWKRVLLLLHVTGAEDPVVEESIVTVDHTEVTAPWLQELRLPCAVGGESPGESAQHFPSFGTCVVIKWEPCVQGIL